MPTLSPLAPDRFPDLPEIAGLRLSTAQAGVRYADRTDVMLAVLDPGASIAGVFTRSATRSAPVLDCQAKLGGDPESGAAILVNSGNSNAFTGRAGEASVARICEAVASACDVPPARVFTSSTGVIGERLPDDRIRAAIDGLVGGLGPANLPDAARAIMTTDTFAKGAAREVETPEGTIRIAGIAKGSGMIAPDMATMLVYIFTDATIAQPLLQDIVGATSDATFNCITVDSDTSTSDTLLAAATMKGPQVTERGGPFELALHDLMLELAHQVVRDGEGASKFITVAVSGAADDDDARKVAMSIANSPLVKTAIAGEDPNWGRIVMAVGKSGAQADRDRLSIRFGDVLVAEDGWVAESYTEEAGAAHMKRREIEVGVDLGLGDGAATVWTCDLTHGYITINADYRS
ncbi:bifunctional glutamate N-acetyltransferase/amino-acid acetyltransferase ArgJ [Palleronia sp. LCG004]|uniref:bifunctional glutamate N-acetyltransferase/amino-acid acetyltransferase ArgJ n=1 Tax=Palleronia sp. LCG004 TaxID=3079304 RepID=UPI002942070B|nr:bifunctional glutamate N-acetyltransferase/amino-acid acetyltransferase ArgJ [Palleronia sp. LCG004]WOI55983.1 bifunctional glutamate N-acetyltransferase/amino-acid acetyltransferase ArgJ [Palleronia sp. LCG004]